MDENILGKKVFFLYPHSVIRDELIKLIMHYEYEVYLLNNHVKTTKLMAKYPDAVLFINIDEAQKESEWEAYIKELMTNAATKDVRIGILSYEKNPELEKKYLMDIMVPCGFVNLKLGLKESARIILKTLEVNEVKGRRKYIRIKCDSSNPGTLNVKINGKFQTGKVIDISSVGMACIFNSKAVELDPKEVVNDIQLRLKAYICTVSGVVIGSRKLDNDTLYVILFNKNIDAQSKSKIQEFISKTLQNSIDREMDAIK